MRHNRDEYNYDWRQTKSDRVKMRGPLPVRRKSINLEQVLKAVLVLVLVLGVTSVLFH